MSTSKKEINTLIKKATRYSDANSNPASHPFFKKHKDLPCLIEVSSAYQAYQKCANTNDLRTNACEKDFHNFLKQQKKCAKSNPSTPSITDLNNDNMTYTY